MKAGIDAIIQAHVAEYTTRIEAPRDALLARMEQRAEANRHPISDPEVASLLAIMVAAARPKRIVEVGTNIGYGAIVLARAAGADARVDTVEKDAGLVKVARDFIAEAGLASRVTVHEDDAIAFLRARKEPVDFVYIDCIKEDYPKYLDLVMPHLTVGGMIAADNVLWRGLVARDKDADVPESERAKVKGLREFNSRLVSHPSLRAVIVPIGDGVALATRIS
jgi:predicted O-methyltransferase YrrM